MGNVVRILERAISMLVVVDTKWELCRDAEMMFFYSFFFFFFAGFRLFPFFFFLSLLCFRTLLRFCNNTLGLLLLLLLLSF